MKITKHQLKRIVRESLLKEELLPLIASDYEDVGFFNRLANYALNNDIQGALADPDMQDETGYLWIEEARDRFEDVAAEWEGAGGGPAPTGWDEDAAYKFLDKLEDAWYNDQRKRDASAHSAAPGSAEREVIGDVFTSGPILPRDIPYVNYQPHRSGGAVVALRLTDTEGRMGHMEVVMDEQDAQGFGTTLQAVMDALEKGGAKLVKKRKPVKYTPPLYD
jgi:hypothetical protein